MREMLLYPSFLIVVFGAMFGYLYVTSEVVEVKVTGKQVREVVWRPSADPNEYVIETRRHGDLVLSTLPFMGYFWGRAEVYHGIRVGGTYRLRIIKFPIIPAPNDISVIQVIE